MPSLGIYSWSQYTIPAGIPSGNLTDDSHANDPATPIYEPTSLSWIGETFTFNGGAPTEIEITDDDLFFEDGYVETGAAQTLAADVTIDGTLYTAGTEVQNEFAMVDAGGREIYVVRIGTTNVGFTYNIGDEPVAGEDFTAAQGIDGDPVDNADGTSSSTEPYTDVICFAAGTEIATPDGARAVDDLRAGDLVITADAGAQPLQWVGRTEVTLSGGPENIRPVLLPAGSLGPGRPARDLVVSPQHRILLDGDDPVFAPAKGLLPLRGVRIMRGKKTVTYVHLMLQRHAVIYAEGTPTESFYPAETALRMMTRALRREVLACCPALRHDPVAGYGPLARRSLSVQQAVAWAKRTRSRAALTPA